MFNGELESIHFVTHDGEMEVLAGHEAVVAPILPCVLKITGPEGEKILAGSGGFAAIQGKKVEVFLDSAEWPVEIDRKRSEEALARAEKRLAEGSSGAMAWEVSRVKASAARAKVRLAALDAASRKREG
jgi:F-type H+-transporting ATPase subunit epsilon